ncbi:MAG: hypothetical protein IKU82_02695 [Clostridia bacterium]|nr:hypothetical protein [Clostridia bacterium]
MKKQLKLYYKTIKRNLPCYNKAMRKMLDDLKVSVDVFIEENNITDFEIVEKHFGNAESVAKEFTAGIDNAYIKSYKLKKYAIIAISSILAAILLVVSSFVAYMIVNLEENTPISADTTITYEYNEEFKE